MIYRDVAIEEWIKLKKVYPVLYICSCGKELWTVNPFETKDSYGLETEECCENKHMTFVPKCDKMKSKLIDLTNMEN